MPSQPEQRPLLFAHGTTSRIKPASSRASSFARGADPHPGRHLHHQTYSPQVETPARLWEVQHNLLLHHSDEGNITMRKIRTRFAALMATALLTATPVALAGELDPSQNSPFATPNPSRCYVISAYGAPQIGSGGILINKGGILYFCDRCIPAAGTWACMYEQPKGRVE